MRATWLGRAALALAALALATPVQAQSFGFPWWRDPQFQRELTLTADQSARIEAIFQDAFSKLRQKKSEIGRAHV